MVNVFSSPSSYLRQVCGAGPALVLVCCFADVCFLTVCIVVSRLALEGAQQTITVTQTKIF